MLKVVFFSFFLFVFTIPALAEDRKTIIHDQAEAELLLGKHSFSTLSLAWHCSSPDCFGDAIIYEEGGVYHINGGHYKLRQSKISPYWGGGYIILKGVITEIQSQRFIFEGTIYTNSFWSGEWKSCLRKGIFQFTRDHIEEYRVDHKEEFWRLYNRDVSECTINSDTSDIDLFVNRQPY